MSIKLGVRWDDENQNERFIEAKELGLIDFIEVNYPIAKNERPEAQLIEINRDFRAKKTPDLSVHR